eukprot:365855-Chlamydomonas_euryale.AAC.12
MHTLVVSGRSGTPTPSKEPASAVCAGGHACRDGMRNSHNSTRIQRRRFWLVDRISCGRSARAPQRPAPSSIRSVPGFLLPRPP